MRLATDSSEETYVPSDFSKIRIGLKTLNDAVLSLGSYGRLNPKYGNKKDILKAIADGDVNAMRDASNFFYKTSGIYSRLCRYMAYLYKYDWFITPYISGCQGLIDMSGGLGDVDTQAQTKEKKKQFNNFFKVLNFFEEFQVKKFFGQVALKVVKNGCYYGYLIPQGKKIVVQELHPYYCRSRYKVNNRPAIEFNMRFFDDLYPNEVVRYKILNLFPKEFKKGYQLYKQGKLVSQIPGDKGWYLLDPRSTVKFNINEEDFPAFISVIPAIIDLDEAKDLDKRKMTQRLLKIIIQKLPLDKNGDLIFDVDEMQELHNNAVKMLSRAIGVDVLTTLADVDVADMSDKGNLSSVDELAKVERGVYNEAGVSQLQFNSDGNIALNNSILNDEASMYNLLLQFESFLNLMLQPFNKSPKRCYYRAQLLTTTIYNYKEMAKLYKQQVSLGYSKMLCQVALGQTQSSVLANAYFENDILDLVRVFIPPMSSNTMNAEVLQNRGNTSSKDVGGQTNSGQTGRPQKEDNEKSEKTIQNKESES